MKTAIANTPTTGSGSVSGKSTTRTRDRISPAPAKLRRKLYPKYDELLTAEVQKARLACFIYFYIQEFGWGKHVRAKRGKSVVVVQVEPSPVSGMRRLGYPNRGKLWRAVNLVHKTCPIETAAYELAMVRYREARRRYQATRNKKTYIWYLCGPGNKNSLAFQSHIAKRRRGGNRIFERGYFRYHYEEMLPRIQERKRAQAEIEEAFAEMAANRQHIFEKMGVPEAFRRLA